MSLSPIITLTTDFGYSDPFAGIIKGVIIGINPDAEIIDITHGIRKFDTKQAALAIGICYKHFPRHTIHVVVADPGVGSERRPILVATEDYYFVGPDNGVFTVIYRENRSCKVLHLTAGHYFMRSRSRTFHGRDIFAPVAAWLSKSLITSKFGEAITDFVTLPLNPSLMPDNAGIEGEIIYIDHFGNAISNISTEEIETLFKNRQGRNLIIAYKGLNIPCVRFYSEAAGKGLFALINSMDYLELFVPEGDASSEFNIRTGDPVKARPA